MSSHQLNVTLLQYSIHYILNIRVMDYGVLISCAVLLFPSFNLTFNFNETHCFVLPSLLSFPVFSCLGILNLSCRTRAVFVTGHYTVST